MILHILGLGFFALLWLLAARGLAEASGPFSRRLGRQTGMIPQQRKLRHGKPGGAFLQCG